MPVTARPAQPTHLPHHSPQGTLAREEEFRGPDFAALLEVAHQQLAGPIVLAWDSLQEHGSATMRRLIAARPWFRVYPLPAYAPEVNPVENVWSHLNAAWPRGRF